MQRISKNPRLNAASSNKRERKCHKPLKTQSGTSKDMIQEISIKNFLSYKDKMTFSFLANQSNFRKEPQVVEVDGVRLLRFAVLYGANASGKTNFLKAVFFLTKFLFRVPQNGGEETGVIPFLLDDKTPQNNSEFNIIFYVKDKRYHYHLVINSRNVISEKLTIGKTEKSVFERTLDGENSKIAFNVKLSKIAKETIEINCLPNMSVFAAYGRVNVTIPELQMVWGYFSNFMPIITDEKDVYGYAVNVLKETGNIKLKQTVLSDLNKADFTIDDFAITEENGAIKDTYYIKIKKDEDKTYTYLMPGYFLSNGTRRYIGLDVILHQLLEKQSFIVADEMENAIHPDLFEKIVYDFLTTDNNQSQLILTTHYSGLLETVMLRPDSVHFVEKKDDGSSELFTLTDFKDLKSLDSSIYKAYRDGRFGAVAKINYNDDRENNTEAKRK